MATSQKQSTSSTTKFNPFAFPSSHHLTVVTSGDVYGLSKAGSQRLFTSGSKGIIAAKEARDGSGHLAVSDHNNVIIHQIENGLKRSYRLEGGEVSEGGSAMR